MTMAAKMNIAGLMVLGCLVILTSAEFDVVPKCPPDSNGKLVYPSNCKLYVQCSGGNSTVESCSNNEVFNAEKLECDLASAVPSCEDGGFLNPPVVMV